MSNDIPAAGDPTEHAARVVEEFRTRFDGRPDGVWAAPGRVNLIGEHVDYNAGRCLPVALGQATYAAVRLRDDDRVTIASSRSERAWSGRTGALGPGEVTGWPSYVAGVVWALREDGLEVPGLDVAVHSDVPVGAGLSSSAALECSVAVAVADLLGLDLDDETRHRIVRASMRAEGEVAGAPTGGMDQTVSVFGQAGRALLLDCRDWSLEQIPWDPESAGLELLVIDTKAHHELVDGGYADRRASCEQAASVLGVETLREVADPNAALAALDDPVLLRRTRHVLTEMARVTEAVADLRAGDYRAFATCLARSHASLRHDFEVSCDELDVAVETSLTAGALGARMTGGGFGGSAIALVPQERVSAVTQAVNLAFVKEGWGAPEFLVARAGAGAARLDH